MKKNFKRLCALMLVLTLCLCQIPAYAEGEQVYSLSIVGVEGFAGGEVEVGTDLAEVLPADPAKYGYRFVGWVVTNAAGEVIETPDQMPDYDVTFTAQWEAAPMYEITFLTEDGELIATRVYAEGQKVEIPTYQVPEGMRIKGWRNAGTGKIEAVPETMPAQDLEYLAVIEEIYYTVTFMDGEDEVGESLAYYGELAYIIGRGDRPDMVFLGWNRDPNALEAEYFVDQEIELTEDLTLYAIWSAASFTVTFMDGTQELGEITADRGETIELIPGPDKEGMVFLGWAESENAEEAEYAAGEQLVLIREMTLYAVWTVAVPEITMKYPTLVFEDEILMNAYFSVTNLDTVAEMGLIVYKQEVAEWNVVNAESVVPGYAYSEADGFYYATTDGIAAKCLGDTLYFAVYAQLNDGSYVYSKLVSYSPETYAYAQLTNGIAKMKPLVVAMLNYGAAAQTYFSYNTGALVNRNLTDEQKSLVEDYRADMMDPVVNADSSKVGIFTNSGGFDSRYPTVSFESAFSINYYFVPSNTPSGTVKMYYWTEADYQGAQTLAVSNATGCIVMEDDGTGTYHALVEGIAAKNLDKTIYVAAGYLSDGTAYCTGVLAYTIGTYCNTVAAGTSSQTSLAEATAVYGYYAKQTFYEQV